MNFETIDEEIIEYNETSEQFKKESEQNTECQVNFFHKNIN